MCNLWTISLVHLLLHWQFCCLIIWALLIFWNQCSLLSFLFGVICNASTLFFFLCLKAHNGDEFFPFLFNIFTEVIWKYTLAPCIWLTHSWPDHLDNSLLHFHSWPSRLDILYGIIDTFNLSGSAKEKSK